MMTPRENLLSTLRRQGFEKVPLDPGPFCESQLEAFKKRFGHGDYVGWFNAPFRSIWVGVEQDFTEWKKFYRHEELPPDISFDSFGVGHSRQPGCYHMTRMHHPLKGDDLAVDDIIKYPFPRFNPQTTVQFKQRTAEIHAQGLAAFGGLACTIWETAWYMRSMEDLMLDMMGEDEKAVVLLDKVTALACQRSRDAALGGMDVLQFGDDIGMQSTTMMSVELWRQWLKPRLAKVVKAAKEAKPDILVFYHSCGYVLPFLEDLIEIGIDILNPVQPECMKFEEVYRQVGARMSFWSTIGTQTTLPFGKPEDVKKAVWENLRICGKRGGIVIGPTHMVEPEVPWENLVAMKEACENFSI